MLYCLKRWELLCVNLKFRWQRLYTPVTTNPCSRPLHARIMNIKQELSARFLSCRRFTGFCRKDLNENFTFNLTCCVPYLHFLWWFAGDYTRSIELCRVGRESLDRLRDVNFRCIWLAQQTVLVEMPRDLAECVTKLVRRSRAIGPREDMSLHMKNTIYLARLTDSSVDQGMTCPHYVDSCRFEQQNVYITVTECAILALSYVHLVQYTTYNI